MKQRILLQTSLALLVSVKALSQSEVTPTRAERIDLGEVERLVFQNEALMEKARSLEKNEVLELDTDEDGDPDLLVWREETLVAAGVDEDDDLEKDATRPDKDQDCWVADYGGDGSIDRAVDYLDLDKDGDPDRSVLYLLTQNTWSSNNMSCVVIGDLDDDNRMWHLIRYEYHQGACQWKCDFIGDEFFAMGYYDGAKTRWISRFENPFCFYDLDGDGASEVAIRFRGTDLRLQSLRYSLDADNDSSSDNPKDFDFSVTALGDVMVPDELSSASPLRGGGHLTHAAWEQGRTIAEWAPWEKALLCWDENDHNVNPRGQERFHERWEGVIAHGSKHFPQEGGPSCGPYNKRYEVDRDFSGKMQLYFSEIDDKIHLAGAEFGWMDVDYNYDGKLDFCFRYEDRDGNGFFDFWSVDGDGDGDTDWSGSFEEERVRLVPWDYEAIQSLVSSALDRAQGKMLPSCVKDYWDSGLPDADEPEKAKESRESHRFHTDLSRVENAMAEGHPPLPLQQTETEPTQTLSLTLTNPLKLQRREEPVLLSWKDVPAIRELPADKPFVTVKDGPEQRAAQLDDLDKDGRFDELVFLANLDPKETKELQLILNPPRPAPLNWRTETNLYMGLSLGWESDLVAFRTYYGKIDVFGKRKPCLQLRRLKGAYHTESDWGMDILHVGTSSGLGGISLVVNGQTFPAMNEPDQEERVGVAKRVLVTGPVRSIVELTLSSLKTPEGIFDLVRRFTIYAGSAYTQESFTLRKIEDQQVTVMTGLMKIPGASFSFGKEENATYASLWGQQKDASGSQAGEVGMAILLPSQPKPTLEEREEDYAILRPTKTGIPLSQVLVADWAKRERFQNADTWHQFIQELSHRLAHPIRYTVKEDRTEKAVP